MKSIVLGEILIAGLASLLISIFLGPKYIQFLREREFGQHIREEGPEAHRLTKAGTETGELVWRMPLAPEYDKMIDSKFADMKNTGGSRWGGAITAAQFIKRFVDDKTPWAHLDIAGTGFDSRQTDINKSWGSGWGVRLLDRLVADHYEK